MFNGVLVDPVPAPAHTISPLARHLYWVSTYVEVAGEGPEAGVTV